MELGLDDRACLITGSTSGIGLAAAVRLALAGARVAVCGRDAGRLALAAEAVATAGSMSIWPTPRVLQMRSARRPGGSGGSTSS